LNIESIAISKAKGTPKQVIVEALLIEGHGIENDAHAGDWQRRVSFLAAESIKGARLY